MHVNQEEASNIIILQSDFLLSSSNETLKENLTQTHAYQEV